MSAAVRPQTYGFGWVVAWGGLTSAVDPTLIKDWGNVAGPWGSVFAIIVALWFLATGVAAASVRPWSWYVLLGCQILGPTWFVLHTTFIAHLSGDVNYLRRGVAAVVFVSIVSVICFAYFYKRRALFRAMWRWRWLERSWSRIVGPEEVSPHARRGFIGLSPLQRGLFVAAVLIWGLTRIISSP